MKKNQHVYDNVKFKTPMKRMLEERAAAEKAKKEAEKAEKPTRQPRKTKED